MTCRNDHITVLPNAYWNSQILHIQAIVNSVVDREGRIFVSHLQFTSTPTYLLTYIRPI